MVVCPKTLYDNINSESSPSQHSRIPPSPDPRSPPTGCLAADPDGTRKRTGMLFHRHDPSWLTSTSGDRYPGKFGRRVIGYPIQSNPNSAESEPNTLRNAKRSSGRTQRTYQNILHKRYRTYSPLCKSTNQLSARDSPPKLLLHPPLPSPP